MGGPGLTFDGSPWQGRCRDTTRGIPDRAQPLGNGGRGDLVGQERERVVSELLIVLKQETVGSVWVDLEF
jgi:hypothetical protein